MTSSRTTLEPLAAERHSAPSLVLPLLAACLIMALTYTSVHDEHANRQSIDAFGKIKVVVRIALLVGLSASLALNAGRPEWGKALVKMAPWLCFAAWALTS